MHVIGISLHQIYVAASAAIVLGLHEIWLHILISVALTKHSRIVTASMTWILRHVSTLRKPTKLLLKLLRIYKLHIQVILHAPDLGPLILRVIKTCSLTTFINLDVITSVSILLFKIQFSHQFQVLSVLYLERLLLWRIQRLL